MEIMLIKSVSGVLIPMGDEEAESIRRIRSGSVVKCNITEMRNGAFFRRWWSLAKLAFDMSSDRMQPREHKGRQVLPCFDEFRKDLIILSGYYDVVYKYDGSFRLKAKSLKWSQMSEDEFAKLYSATIDAVLQKILPDIDAKYLESAVNQTMSYA